MMSINRIFLIAEIVSYIIIYIEEPNIVFNYIYLLHLKTFLDHYIYMCIGLIKIDEMYIHKFFYIYVYTFL